MTRSQPLIDPAVRARDAEPRAMPPGHVFWITGLSGAGKSTTARDLACRLRSLGRNVVLLDGDELRSVYGEGLGFSTADRKALALRHAKLCRLLASQGLDVICATISLFHACHAWLRQNLLHYHEVYLRVTLDELRRRDPKGLYQQTAASDPGHVVGVDLPVEEPVAPDVLIENDGRLTPDEVAEQLWRYVQTLKGFPVAS